MAVLLRDAHRQIFCPETKRIYLHGRSCHKVCEVAYLLKEIDVNIFEHIIIYYTLRNLPKEYEIFKKMQIIASTLLAYKQLEAKLILEETSIW